MCSSARPLPITLYGSRAGFSAVNEDRSSLEGGFADRAGFLLHGSSPVAPSDAQFHSMAAVDWCEIKGGLTAGIVVVIPPTGIGRRMRARNAYERRREEQGREGISHAPIVGVAA